MDAAGLNQRKLAQKANMDAVQLNRILKFKKKPGGISLARIAAALDCTVEELHQIPAPNDSYVHDGDPASAKLALIERILSMDEAEAAGWLSTINADPSKLSLDKPESRPTRRSR